MDTIIRVEHRKDRPYVVVSKSMAEDIGLSFEERGLLLYLLTKPDDWRIIPEQLATENGVSRSHMYEVLSRLIKSGYIYRDYTKYQEEGKWRSTSLYIVFEDREARRDFLAHSFISSPHQPS